MFTELEQMAHEKNIITPKERAELKAEAAKIKPYVVAIKGWRLQVVAIDPQYNSMGGSARMTNILMGTTTDIHLLSVIKQVLINNKVVVPGIIEYDKKGRYIKK